LSTEGPETSTFESEAAALQEILRLLPDKNHRNILSQMLIMTNARESSSRVKLAVQVKHALLDSMEENKVDLNADKATQLIFHLARLKKPYRVLFGKSLFKAMSKLYKQSEKDKAAGKKQKKSSPSRRSPKQSSPRSPREIISSEEVESDGVPVDASPTSAISRSNNEKDASISVEYQCNKIPSPVEV
jgi:hypothetical protein